MRRAISAMSALAVAAVLPFVATTSAAAEDPPLPAAPEAGQGAKKLDNRTHPLAARRTALRQEAIDQLLSGEAELKGRGSNRTIEMADGVEVDYDATQHANLLTFLVEFGESDPEDLADPEFPAEGPLHNEIPEPDENDNTTYWKPDFNRGHFLDMFFNGMSDQGGESFKDLYHEMSSGRFDLEGDVSDWVQVPEAEAYYSDEDGYENQPEMTAFIGDSANAWYDAQVTAGKSDAEITDYLAQYDVWDRYDIDGDGDYDEPDGYIDHFQAVHAGVGEEAGGPIWSIWSHRWAANYAGFGVDGPEEGSCEACYPVGGVEIGDTGYFIFDYTTEPENGGLGVFAHEFGHDLGLPDYYDTIGGDNSNGYWTLMDSGSWLGHGEDSIGSSAGHMGSTEKLFLGWYGAETADGFEDLAVVDGLSEEPQEVTLGPSYHATDAGKQAVLVTLPDGHDVAEGPVGGDYLYSGTKDGTSVTATSPPITLPGGSPTLSATVQYSIEQDYDFAYLQASTNGGSSWSTVMTSKSGTGGGITGDQLTQTGLTADLSAYASQEVLLRWAYVTDANTHGVGFMVHDLTVGSYSTSFTNADDWTLNGFFSVVGGEYDFDFTQSYMAENRTFDGYDVSLTQGPYSFNYPVSAPDKVDHYSYEDGLLLYYSNSAYGDNNTSDHPGHGANLPVDAHPGLSTWTGTGPNATANGRLQAFDATFDVDDNSAVSMTRERVGGGSQSVTIPARPAIPVFEDTDPDAYYDAGGGGMFSTKVAGTGAMIQVVSSDESIGQMKLKIGKRFVSAIGNASLTGTAQPGNTLTATAPAWFQTGVTNTVTWLRDGTPIAGASGSTYVVQGADAGHTVSARITGSKEGYGSTTTTTNGLPATQAGAPVATAAPKITGTAKVGKTLKVAGATWPVAGTSTYAWSVGGKKVGTGTSYAVKPADAGKKVTVTETFTSPGYAAGSASATSGTVAKASVKLKLKVGKAKKNKKVSLTVNASSDVKVAGKVRVTYGGKTVGTFKLKSGKVNVKLPKRGKGTYKLKVAYQPAKGFNSANKTVKVKVK